MLTYVIGDLFESPARVLVNTVNMVGVMGKGIAKEFKRIYPEMFREYQKLCEKKLLTEGKLWLYKTPNKWILNFPTKTTWRQPSHIRYIENGLKTFVRTYAAMGITSIAFPPLGCGNGELDWETQVRPVMEKYLNKLPIDIFIHLLRKDSRFAPEHRNIKTMRDWLRSEPTALGFVEVWEDLTREIGSGLDLQRLTDEKPFHIKIAFGTEPGIVILADSEQHLIPKDDLLELWSLVRDYGFSTNEIMPASLERFIQELIVLFSRLSYCRAVEVSNKYSDLGEDRTIGLQLVPISTTQTFMQPIAHEVVPADPR